jgi:hypothetical protein
VGTKFENARQEAGRQGHRDVDDGPALRPHRVEHGDLLVAVDVELAVVSDHVVHGVVDGDADGDGGDQGVAGVERDAQQPHEASTMLTTAVTMGMTTPCSIRNESSSVSSRTTTEMGMTVRWSALTKSA